jgi:hypothetical protein
MNKKNILSGIFLLAAAGMNAQNIAAEKSVIDMGEVLYRTPASVVFTLHNKSANELRLETVRTDCGCTDVKFPINGIAANSDFKVEAIYDAKTLGHFQKQIGVYEAGSDSPVMLTIKGVVVSEKKDFSGKYPYTIGDFLTDVDNVEFDDVNRGDRPVQKIHIQNKSDKVAEPQVMHLPPYLRASVQPKRLAPGYKGVVSIQLDSRKLRDFGLNQTEVYLGLFPGDKVNDNKVLPVSAVLLPSFAHLNAAQRASAPVFSASSTKLDLGSFGKKKKLKGTIIITNKGKKTLEINSLQMSTVGLEVSLNNTHIEPGKSAKLKITALAGLLQRRRPRVLMITNDPKQPKVVINVVTR